uniref:Uncharacterized protein n=1 Tax=Aquila chrysaetos chrysaetos TaxID=223781 RepID=A0A663E7W2_AQUCH
IAITLQHIGKKTTLRLMCPQTQVVSEMLSCFKMINVTIFSVHHLVRTQRVQKKTGRQRLLGPSFFRNMPSACSLACFLITLQYVVPSLLFSGNFMTWC